MIDRKHSSYRKSAESGVTTVEAAIFLIALFMLILGVIEAGQFMKTRQVLTNAAREGARFAVAPTSGTNTLPGEAEVQAKVNSFLAAAGVAGATTTTKCPTSAAEVCTTKDSSMSVNTGLVTTEYTEVTVAKPYSVLTAPGFFSALSINLQGKALMRRETSE
jgi:Flp pilus assembly protein TadG